MESNGYRCDLCDRGFGSLRQLLAHRRTSEHNRKRGEESLKMTLRNLKKDW